MNSPHSPFSPLIRMSCALASLLILTLAPLIMAPLSNAYGDADKDPLQQLLREGKFKKVASLAKKGLRKQPEEFRLMAYYEVALRGQKKTKKAEQVAKLHKEKWLAGPGSTSPKADARWLRVVHNSETHHIFGYEYYIPNTRRVKGITYYYTFEVFPKEGNGKRTIHLEMSNLIRKFHVMREELHNGGAQLLHYGDKKPTLEKFLEDVLAQVSPKKEAEKKAKKKKKKKSS